MSKGVKKVTRIVEKAAKSVGKTIASPFEAAWHAGEAGVKLLEGDLSGASEAFGKATGDITRGIVGVTNVGLIAPKVNDLAYGVGRAVGTAVTGNINKATHALYDTTGIDIGAIEEKQAEKAAQAEYDRQVADAEATAQRNRRANLLATRKSLAPSLSRSSQGGGGSGNNQATAVGGIILG